MNSYPSDDELARFLRNRIAMDTKIEIYTELCSKLVTTWFCLLDFEDMDDWFDSSRCCIPITLAHLLHKRYVKHFTNYEI